MDEQTGATLQDLLLAQFARHRLQTTSETEAQQSLASTLRLAGHAVNVPAEWPMQPATLAELQQRRTLVGGSRSMADAAAARLGEFANDMAASISPQPADAAEIDSLSPGAIAPPMPMPSRGFKADMDLTAGSPKGQERGLIQLLPGRMDRRSPDIVDDLARPQTGPAPRVLLPSILSLENAPRESLMVPTAGKASALGIPGGNAGGIQNRAAAATNVDRGQPAASPTAPAIEAQADQSMPSLFASAADSSVGPAPQILAAAGPNAESAPHGLQIGALAGQGIAANSPRRKAESGEGTAASRPAANGDARGDGDSNDNHASAARANVIVQPTAILADRVTNAAAEKILPLVKQTVSSAIDELRGEIYRNQSARNSLFPR